MARARIALRLPAAAGVLAAGLAMAALATAGLAWGGAPGAGASALIDAPLAAPQGTAGVVSGTVRITNVTDQGFTVSWLTTAAVTGAVRYGQDPSSMTAIAQDDITTASRTHHVTLGDAELLPDTRYYYDLLTSAGLDNNGGVHYMYATGTTLSLPSPGDSIYGQVVTATGGSLPGSIVYLWLQDAGGAGSPGWSQPKSVPAVESVGWYLNTSGMRQGDLTDYFGYAADTDLVKLAVQGAPDGRATDSFPVNLGANRTVTVTAGTLPAPAAPAPVAAPAPDLVVTGVTASPAGPRPGCPVALTVSIRNQGGAGAAAPFRVALYLDHSRVPYPGERSNTNTYWVVTQTLAAGGTLSLSTANPAVASGVIDTLAASGAHTVYAQVDSYNNQVAETSEVNNLSAPVVLDVTGVCQRIYLPMLVKGF